MGDLSRRAHARIPCDSSVEVFLGATVGRSMGVGRLLDVSLTGAHLQVSIALQRGTPYHLRFEGPDGPFQATFRVVREGARAPRVAAARHYGIAFNFTTDQEKVWTRFLDLLRRRPISGEDHLDRALRHYWPS